jgi:hypothetical protein
LLFGWQNFIYLQLLGTINPMMDYLIPIMAICYLKLDLIIGSDQLDETSSTLSRSFDPIPQQWSSDTNYDLLISAMVS